MSLWAVMGAPLISSTDLTKISPSALAVLSNTDVIAIDQDPAGVQSHIVQFDDDYDVLAKPLANGDIAVVFYNKGIAPKKIATTAAVVGFKSSSSLQFKNLVSSVTTSRGAIGDTSRNGNLCTFAESGCNVLNRLAGQGQRIAPCPRTVDSLP
jgi:alpha-galactosidase